MDSTTRFERVRAVAVCFAGRCLRPLGYVEKELVGEDGFEPPRLMEDLGYGQVQSTALPLTHEWHLVHESNVRPPAS